MQSVQNLNKKLITNRKSHTGGFQLVPTLNDLDWRNSPYFAFFSPNSIALQADYVTVVKGRPIMSIKYCLTYWTNVMHI